MHIRYLWTIPYPTVFPEHYFLSVMKEKFNHWHLRSEVNIKLSTPEIKLFIQETLKSMLKVYISIFKRRKGLGSSDSFHVIFKNSFQDFFDFLERITLDYVRLLCVLIISSATRFRKLLHIQRGLSEFCSPEHQWTKNREILLSLVACTLQYWVDRVHPSRQSYGKWKLESERRK